MPPIDLPILPSVSVDRLPDTVPTRIISEEDDVQRWHRSTGFSIYMLFLHRLNEAVAGHNFDEELDCSPVSVQRHISCDTGCL